MVRNDIRLLGVPVDRIDRAGLIRYAAEVVRARTRAKIMYVNIHVMNLACRDNGLSKALNHSHMVYCDGAGVRAGARILGKSLPPRMTGADWIWDLCVMCKNQGYSLYLLGGKPGRGEKAARILSKRHPGLRVAGTHHGFFNKTGSENDRVIADINNRTPDILLVGFGTPRQEKWIHNNFGRIDAHVIWAVGALVDFVSESIPRGPRWMVDHGFEWLYRLGIEPKRMWKRYLIGNLVFFGRILRTAYRINKKSW
jgi:N-acetylglucosaminyldiphosphoundecaprenol N-acetyl-beta-D-mannosaminyltransferase